MESGVQPDLLSCGGSGRRRLSGRGNTIAKLAGAFWPGRGGDTSSGVVGVTIDGLTSGAGVDGGLERRGDLLSSCSLPTRQPDGMDWRVRCRRTILTDRDQVQAMRW